MISNIFRVILYDRFLLYILLFSTVDKKKKLKSTKANSCSGCCISADTLY